LGSAQRAFGANHSTGGSVMGKGMDRKKESKKKPAKSLMEKRAAKHAKREGRSLKTVE
jgi:hypothetical protein